MELSQIIRVVFAREQFKYFLVECGSRLGKDVTAEADSDKTEYRFNRQTKAMATVGGLACVMVLPIMGECRLTPTAAPKGQFTVLRERTDDRRVVLGEHYDELGLTRRDVVQGVPGQGGVASDASVRDDTWTRTPAVAMPTLPSSGLQACLTPAKCRGLCGEVERLQNGHLERYDAQLSHVYAEDLAGLLAQHSLVGDAEPRHKLFRGKSLFFAEPRQHILIGHGLDPFSCDIPHCPVIG